MEKLGLCTSLIPGLCRYILSSVTSCRCDVLFARLSEIKCCRRLTFRFIHPLDPHSNIFCSIHPFQKTCAVKVGIWWATPASSSSRQRTRTTTPSWPAGATTPSWPRWPRRRRWTLCWRSCRLWACWWVRGEVWRTGEDGGVGWSVLGINYQIRETWIFSSGKLGRHTSNKKDIDNTWDTHRVVEIKFMITTWRSHQDWRLWSS